MTDASPSRLTVIGLGNPLMGDDGLGLAALARLIHDWDLPPTVQVLDGGTWGMNLLPMIEEAESLLFLDAIDARADPGTHIVLERDEIPRYFANKLSPHQIDLREVLALAEWRGTLPARTAAMGLQPETIEMGVELSPLLKHRLPALVEAVAQRLRQEGHALRRRRVAAYA